MTSSSRRKRQTTAAPSTPARMAVSLAALSLMWACPLHAHAQESQPSAHGFAIFDNAPPVPISPLKKTETIQRVGYQPAIQANLQPAAIMIQERPSVAGQPAAAAIGQPATPGFRDRTPSDLEYQIQLEPPGPQRLFQLESEKSLHERMRQEARERPIPERIEFPEEP